MFGVYRSALFRRWGVVAMLLGGTLGCVGCKSEPKQTEPSPKKESVAETALGNKEAAKLERPIAVGEEVFDFSALAHTGQRFKLSEFLDKPVLVYFCPQDAAVPCTDVATSIMEDWLALRPHLSMAFGVNKEPTVIHREFASEHKLPHLLVSDAKETVHGVMGQKLGAFSSYLIGTDRKVLKAFVPPNPKTHAQEVLAALGELGLLRAAPTQ